MSPKVPFYIFDSCDGESCAIEEVLYDESGHHMDLLLEKYNCSQDVVIECSSYPISDLLAIHGRNGQILKVTTDIPCACAHNFTLAHDQTSEG